MITKCKKELDQYIEFERQNHEMIIQLLQAKIKKYKDDKNMDADLRKMLIGHNQKAIKYMQEFKKLTNKEALYKYVILS